MKQNIQSFLTEKQIFYISVSSVIYFLLLYLNSNYFYSDFVLIGVFQEILTIPLMVGTFALFGLVSASVISRKYTTTHHTYSSLGLLTLSVISLIVSFLR